jgi:hypothetical protein
MLTNGDVYTAHAGTEVKFTCEFEAGDFNLFNNPVVWKKSQFDEERQMNMLGNLLPPFNDSKFSTYYEESKPRYTLGLTIKSKFLITNLRSLVMFIRCIPIE